MENYMKIATWTLIFCAFNGLGALYKKTPEELNASPSTFWFSWALATSSIVLHLRFSRHRFQFVSVLCGVIVGWIVEGAWFLKTGHFDPMLFMWSIAISLMCGDINVMVSRGLGAID